jgi:hypothetical protein
LISGVVTFCAAASLASTARFTQCTIVPAIRLHPFALSPLTVSNTAHLPSKETGSGA